VRHGHWLESNNNIEPLTILIIVIVVGKTKVEKQHIVGDGEYNVDDNHNNDKNNITKSNNNLFCSWIVE
jgi:hypothetical protein